MAELFVCAGATCQCAAGSAPAALVVTSQTILSINDVTVATVMDYLPMTNVPTFGTCALLTAAALGVSTPCVPVTVAPWTPGSTVKTVNNLAVLTAPSTLTCGIGGAITITDPANTIFQGD